MKSLLEHMSGRGRKRRALSDIGAVTAHGVGWSARVYIDECNVLGPLRSCKEDAEADLERPRAASSREQLRLAAQRMKPGFASPVSLELCGINVQYPWSPLILAGVKAVEVRKYRLAGTQFHCGTRFISHRDSWPGFHAGC